MRLRCLNPILRGIRRNFFRLSPCGGQVAYVLLTRAPVAGRAKQASLSAAPRLACVKPVASVHPEPGSNSSLFILFSSFLYQEGKIHLVCLPKARPAGHSDHDAAPARCWTVLLRLLAEIDRVKFICSCTTFVSIVNLSMCVFCLSGEKRCKFTASFYCDQIFVHSLTSFNVLAALLRLSLKSECKGTAFCPFLQIF